MKNFLLPALIAVALPAVSIAGAVAAERAKATVDCAAAGERYVYDCTIMLTGKKSGKPMTGAKIVVGADMPAMAMAHNVRPVTAEPMGKTPGMYRFRIRLAMHGEWALRLDVSGPTRDRLIHVMRFGGKMESGSEEMKHGKGGMGGMKMEK